MKKRILSTLMALALCLSLLPTAAFAEGEDAHGADTPSCSCETACAADAMNAECPLCGAEGAAAENCGKHAAPAPETDETAAVQALIDALPAVEDVTETDYDAVQDTCDAYEALTDDQQAQIVGLAKLAALLEWFNQQIDLTAGVQYLDANGNRKTVTDYTTVSDSTGDVTWENGGWYVVNSDVTISGLLLMAIREVNLILCDGKTLTVEGGILADDDLTIYGQSAGTGKLTVGDVVSGDESKGIQCYNLTVNGGSITATGGDTDPNGTENSLTYSYGISCNDLTVNGGSITATGGNVTATGEIILSCGINCDDLTLSGGKITALGGNITVPDVAGNSDELTASSCGLACADMTVTGGSIDATGGDVTCNANVENQIYSYGISAYDVTLKNGAVKATSGDVTYASDGENQSSVKSKSIGFDCDDMTMVSGTITATAGEASTTLKTGGSDDAEYRARSLAIHGNDMVVRGGTVTATADNAAVHIEAGGCYAATYSCGIYADLTVTGGTVKAAAGDEADALLDLPPAACDPDDISARVYSCGIISYGDSGRMAYTGGTVTATSGSSSYGVGSAYEGDEIDYTGCEVSHNFGIYSKDGHISVTGGKIAGVVGGSGKINISGGTIENASTEADATLTISGGKIDFVSVENDSAVIISGGTVGELHLYPAAAPVLSGGTFDSITWVAEDGGDTPNLVNALADGYAYYVKGSGSSTYDTLTTPVGGDWYSEVENVQIRAHSCDFVNTGAAYTCTCGRIGSQEKIAYLDKNGATQYRVDYTVLDSSYVDKLESNSLKLPAGWYAVKGDVTLSDGIRLEGDVHLILCDSAKMSTTQIYDGDDNAYDLTVYAQSTGDKMGSLLVIGSYVSSAITLAGDLTIVGGSVVAKTESNGIDVYGDLTVLGGSVKGTGNLYGIYVSNELTVSGGVLEGIGGSEENDDWGSTGVSCDDLYVTGGKIIGTSGATQGEFSSDGIYVRDSMTVSGGIVEGTGGKASGEGDSAFSSGICVTADVTISGGTVTGKSITTDDDATHYSYGFKCYDLTVSGGTITATAGIASATDDSALSYGIYCDDLTVSGGTITATGSKASGALTALNDDETRVIASMGICCQDTNITGGTVTAKGDTAAYRGDYAITPFSYGMNCDNLTIKGGSLTFTSNDASGASVGVFSYGEISATGGTLTAKAEQTSAYDSAALYAEDGVTLGSKTKIITPSGGAVKMVAVTEPLYTVVAQDSTPAQEVVIQRISTSSGSSSGGSSSDTTSTTVKNPDGSTTTTTTNKKTGTVTETTKTATGTTATTVTDKNGNSQTTVSVSSTDARSGKTITLPVDSVKPASGKNAEEITVEIPKNTSVTVEIPVKNVTPGTVVVIVGEDGTETVVPTTGMTENGVTVTLTGNATIKIVENSTAFSDVPANAYYADAVDFAFSRGITGGIDATHFDPHASCTRAQLVTFLWRAVGQPTVDGAMDFADVDADAYYCEAVRWAASLGIVSGYGNGLFGSGNVITREQMAVILYRFAQAVGMDTTQGGMAVREYNDYESISDYAVSAMQWAVNAGILQGNDGNLLPSAPCTRAQIVTMLYRLLSK